MTDQTPAENQPKPTPRRKPTSKSAGAAKKAASDSRFKEIFARISAGVGAPPPKQNSSTDLRTQLAYVLADKLEEYRGEKFGYEPGEAPARGKGALKTAVGDALSKMRYGTTKPAEVKDGVIQDPGTRGGISTPTRKRLGRLSATSRWKKIEGIPGMPKLPSRKKEESTNLKDRMVQILAEARGDAIQKLGIPLTHITGSDRPVVPPRGHRVAKKLAGQARERRRQMREPPKPPPPNYVRPTPRSRGDNRYTGDSD